MSALTRAGRLLAPAVLLLPLAACGDDEGSYCSALESEQETFAEMQNETSGPGLLKYRTTLGELAAEAPDDLRDEWQTFLGALDALSDTLDEAGVEPEEFVDERPPPGLSATDRTLIANAASELGSEDVVEAANGIEQQAKDVCKLQLGL
jgi:hypothetical protein